MILTIENIIIIVCLIIVFGILFMLYRYLVSLDTYVLGMAALLERTFEHYYKSENITPQSVNWGIDLVWNPKNENIEGEQGFITIYYGMDSGIDTPIDDVVEADILSQKIIGVVDKHMQDKELGLIK